MGLRTSVEHSAVGIVVRVQVVRHDGRSHVHLLVPPGAALSGCLSQAAALDLHPASLDANIVWFFVPKSTLSHALHTSIGIGLDDSILLLSNDGFSSLQAELSSLGRSERATKP